MMKPNSLGKASGDKANYCQSTASQESKMEGYYQNGRDAQGVWVGSGLSALGLKSGMTVSDEAYKSVIRGYSASGEDLGIQGAGDDHRAGWDLTFSAPKSVSLAAAAADIEMRPKIIAAHDAAVKSALQVIEEKSAFCRRGKSGEEHEKLSGLVFAMYQHDDSRELDPQLHSHVLAMNVAGRDDGTFGGIESKYFFEWEKAVGAVYRAELAKNMVELGFEVKKDREFFKLGGISNEISKHFSKRRTQIEGALKKAGLPTGNAKTSEIAALSTRKKKLLDVVKETLLAGWKTELEKLGLTSNKINEIASGKHAEIDNSNELEFIETEETADANPIDLYEHLAAHESVFTEKDLYRIIAERAQVTGIGLDGIKKEVAAALGNSEIIKLGNGKMTTRRILEIETKLVDQAQTLKGRQGHGLTGNAVKSALAEFTQTKGFSLSSEQASALTEITETGNLKMVRGAAGSGKSTMLAAAKIAYEKSGYKVIGMALSGKAAAGLQEGSGIESSTIHRFLIDYENDKIVINENSVIVMDEAGMTGSELMQRITEIAVKNNAKLIAVGDERQLQSVSAGGAFKLLQNQLKGFSQLNEVRRQRDSLDKDAANAIAAGEGAAALKSYIDRGLVTVGKTVDTARESLVKAWSADTHAISEKIILAQTRNDVFHLNNLARSQLKLAPGNMIKTSIGEREISNGERIMITKNDNKLGVKNGQFATVEDMKFTRNGEVKLTVKIDGNPTQIHLQVTGENAFNHFDHGYAATVHKSQGATVDSAYFYASSMGDKELAYVAMSRHRDQCQVFTPLSKLEDALDQAGIEVSADDLLANNINNTLKKLGESLEQSNQKGTTLDYISQEKAVEILAETKTKTYEAVVSSPSAAALQEVEMEM
jgi:Ti-type conjugative transfer relaxase TraA